jgi:hypothetical protein
MAPNSPEILPNSIDALRAGDSRDTNNELSPEKQTLNDRRVLEFLQRPGVLGTDGKFNLDTAISMLREGKTSTEAMLRDKMQNARKILEPYGKVALMEEDESVVRSTLENLQTPPTNMPKSQVEQVLNAFGYYKLIKWQANRFLDVGKTSIEARKTVFTESKGIVDTVKESLGGAMENWDKLPSGQKMMMAGMALLGGIWLFTSKNETISKIKDYLKTGVKVAGGAWLFNKVWYLFSGESFLDYAKGTVSKQTGSKYLAEVYNTDEKGADLMTKAFVHMGEMPFNTLLAQYKNSTDRTLKGSNMPPAEAYSAFELFMKKYGEPADKLKAYEKYDPPISFSQVAIIEMSNDPNVKMKESLAKRVGSDVSDFFKNGYNYIAASAPALCMSEKYKKWFGKEATPEELKTFATRFGEIVPDQANVNDAIKDRLLRNDAQKAKNYVDTNIGGQSEPRYNLKYRDAADGYIYIIVDKEMNNVQGDNTALNQTLVSCISTAEGFLVDKFKADKNNVATRCQPDGTVFVSNSATLKYLVRYKK